jgi:Dienelactone hydrolase family
LAAAARYSERVAAAASFSGTWLVRDAEESPHLSLGKVKGELYIACAEHDELAPLPMVDELRTLFQRAGSPGEIELYPGVYHGFAFRNAGATTSRPRSAIGSGSSPSVGGVWARTEPPQSIELQRSAVQLFGSLDLDQHRMPLLLRVAVLFGLDQPTPHLFIYRSRAVDLRPAVKSGDATLR